MIRLNGLKAKIPKVVLGPGLLFIVVCALLAALMVNLPHVDLVSLEEEMKNSIGVRWIFIMMLLVVATGVAWIIFAAFEESGEPVSLSVRTALPPLTEAERVQAQREYVLEVISLGVTLDKYRQGKLWDALSRGSAYATIREQDPKKYPWGAREKGEQEGKRSDDALENGAKYTPSNWGVPAFAVDSAAGFSPDDPYPGFIGVAAASKWIGMSSELFVAAGSEQSDRPDRLMERVFRFFDEHPDVPYVVISAADGLYFRDLYRPKGVLPLIRDGYYVPEMPDSTVVFVLARRERVDPLRPFAFEDFDTMSGPFDVEDFNRKGFARRIFLAHLRLSEDLPKPKGALYRTPTTAEWLQETAAIARRPDMYPKAPSAFEMPWEKGRYPSRDFRPTPWFPIPWNKSQLAEFDRLPTLGFIHRPVFVKTVDGQGRPLRRSAARAAALAAGWQEALQTLPEGERAAAPARVVVSTAGRTEQTIALGSVLQQWTDAGGPELDRNKPTEWIDTDARLGNTGAASWFMGMAIGVMGSYREGGASAAINLRDPAEASIVFITPPSEEKRRTQQHSQGGDVWRSIVGPAIDPGNYTQ
ncbi:type VI lipase adapter Tla3 domain-containing protein [Azohydromonas aeria]|uniref:type VI lipase adapter Tla3 domain-containing protein n=1 Tax=Azohydromonas aeria TaxID=2590212 RepID=UPI0012FC5AC5|nr:DUF2875 family protein [Azohydromonas aeria]